MKNKHAEILLTMFILMTFAIAGIVTYALYTTKALEAKINGLEFDLRAKQTELNKLSEENYIPVKMTVTGYAPLDPDAIEGMCYSGDPNVTASGAKSDPNRTIAAGPGIPFGTQIYIPGIGNRIVEDRGSAITDNHIDIMFWKVLY